MNFWKNEEAIRHCIAQWPQSSYLEAEAQPQWFEDPICIYDQQEAREESPLQKLILCSQSPRRQQLVRHLLQEQQIRTRNVDERALEEQMHRLLSGCTWEEKVLLSCAALAEAKAVEAKNADEIVLSADTQVVTMQGIYNKPRSREEAEQMLRSYFGHTHVVVSAVCLRSVERQMLFATLAQVHFASYQQALEPSIQEYLEQGSPMDKAGAYGIQELDPRWIQWVHGDLYTVIAMSLSNIQNFLSQWR